MSLEDLRLKIDSIDSQIVRLLNDRAEVSLEVGKQKAENKSARYFAPERERDMIGRLLELHGTGALPKDALLAIYREIISASIALQKPMTVAYWGPSGTFTEMAAMSRFGSSASYYDCAGIADVFGEVERGRADYGVVPVENSTEGVVNYTLDMFHDTPLKICAEIFVLIVQNLLTQAKSLGEIQRLYTGPQPLAQCRRWLDEHLPNVEVIEVMPTSKSAERAAADPNGAAIAPKRSSEVYGVPMLYESIEENEPGSLGRALRAFETFNVNLTMVATRPARNTAWEYVQFVDFQGHENDEPVKQALEALRAQSIYVNVLGSYPEG
jgi:chorismate mutase/prephenate dehydratase